MTTCVMRAPLSLRVGASVSMFKCTLSLSVSLCVYRCVSRRRRREMTGLRAIQCTEPEISPSVRGIDAGHLVTHEAHSRAGQFPCASGVVPSASRCLGRDNRRQSRPRQGAARRTAANRRELRRCRREKIRFSYCTKRSGSWARLKRRGAQKNR